MDPSKSILGIHKTISSLVGHLRKLVIRFNDLEKNVNNQSKKITSLKNISKTQSERISGENIGAKLPGGSTDNVNESLKAIADSLTSIADILAGRKKLTDATAAADRQKAEQDKRALAESKLEKRFDGLKKTAEKIIAPVKSILDRIIDFFVTVFLGRVVYKLLEWFGDPKNADKVKAIGRFLGDHWPKLLALYLVFGNAFGRFALGLAKGVAAGAVKLAFAIAKLLAAKKVKGAMGAAKFLGRGPGKLLANVVGTVATVGGAYALTQGMKGDDGGEQKTQNLAGGGYVRPRFPTFSGGGFNFKDMMGGAGLGAMFGPLGMMLGAGAGAVSGFVSGEKGVDKVPAMLSDGEFVMSRGAVAKYGVDTLESMNAAGGGTNKPKIMGGTTYAQGGGLMGENPDPNYKNPGQEKRLELMKALEEYGTNVAKSAGDLPLVKAAMNLASVLRGGGGTGGSGVGVGGNKIPTGSLLTDPSGAVARIMSNMGVKPPGMPGGFKLPGMPGGFKLLGMPEGVKLPGIPGGVKLPGMSGGVKLPGMPGPVQEVIDKLSGPGAATYRDAGAIYARQMLGGLGGPVSEQDLGKESQAELQKAIQRAKKRTGSEIAKAEAKIKELRAQGAKDGNPALETQKSFLKKMKAGGIRVQYTDYADEKGQMSESAKNAKNILGQFFAYERSKEEGGGYRVEDKYDFDMFKKKDDKTGKMRDMNTGELITEGVFGKGKTIQQRLQAAYLLNPFKGKGDVDMVLGGRRTGKEIAGLGASKTLFGGLLGISGNPMVQKQKEEKERQEFQKKNPGAMLYGPNDPRGKSTSYQSRFARPKNAGVKPVPPPVKPKPKITVVNAPGSGRRGAAPGRSNGSNVPNFGATSPKGGDAKAKTLGLGNRRGG